MPLFRTLFSMSSGSTLRPTWRKQTVRMSFSVISIRFNNLITPVGLVGVLREYFALIIIPRPWQWLCSVRNIDFPMEWNMFSPLLWIHSIAIFGTGRGNNGWCWTPVIWCCKILFWTKYIFYHLTEWKPNRTLSGCTIKSFIYFVRFVKGA